MTIARLREARAEMRAALAKQDAIIDNPRYDLTSITYLTACQERGKIRRAWAALCQQYVEEVIDAADFREASKEPI